MYNTDSFQVVVREKLTSFRAPWKQNTSGNQSLLNALVALVEK